MHIERINGVYYVYDKSIDSTTRDTNMSRAIKNAIMKHIACRGTDNPTRDYVHEEIRKRKEARTGARLAFIY
jgi:hypothetical protein